MTVTNVGEATAELVVLMSLSDDQLYRRLEDFLSPSKETTDPLRPLTLAEALTYGFAVGFINGAAEPPPEPPAGAATTEHEHRWVNPRDLLAPPDICTVCGVWQQSNPTQEGKA